MTLAAFAHQEPLSAEAIEQLKQMFENAVAHEGKELIPITEEELEN